VLEPRYGAIEGVLHGGGVERASVVEADTAPEREAEGVVPAILPPGRQPRLDAEVAREPDKRLADAGVERVHAKPLSIEFEDELVSPGADDQLLLVVRPRRASIAPSIGLPAADEHSQRRAQ